ncbi:MAG: beta-1,4-mannanase [Verrucomicrobiaceae bacterium]|nr:MAG: beta-1,4-mannanase [Verrucomicrobiaceae bacterium]
MRFRHCLPQDWQVQSCQCSRPRPDKPWLGNRNVRPSESTERNNGPSADNQFQPFASATSNLGDPDPVMGEDLLPESQHSHQTLGGGMIDKIRLKMRTGAFTLDEAIAEVRRETIELLRQINISGNTEGLDQTLQDARRTIVAESEKNRETLRQRAIVTRQPQPAWYIEPTGAKDAPRWTPYLAKLVDRDWNEITRIGIDRDTSAIVSRLPPPDGRDTDGRGLVLGHVQSGKTANMMGVIAKAADAGYRLVIVLAGLTRALRRQTQKRIEKDLIDGNEDFWIKLTRSSPADQPDQDFSGLADQRFTLNDAKCQIMVIKKNVTPLVRLLEHIRNTTHANKSGIPVLIVDDECDQASVNAAKSEYDTTRINALIKEILAQLPKSAYVGYTATPFANMLINPNQKPDQLEDLYPRDFIYALKRSENYFGPEQLFGRDQLDADAEEPDASGLDMIRRVEDKDVRALQPKQQEKTSFVPTLPSSLEIALDYFLLATAARRHRGQTDDHASMLIHTTLYTRSHEIITEMIDREWLKPRRDEIGRQDPSTIDKLRTLWNSEIVRVDASQFGNTETTFEELLPHLDSVAVAAELAIENMDSDSRLVYEKDDPKTYIVVGGSILARGLTIEGLTVSYFTRASTQFDTLLQMGRWFGYRGGYEDLPRIWMTANLETAFHRLATVEAEIRHDIDIYIKKGLSPLDVAVRIRMIPGMKATAAAKLKHAVETSVSFAGRHVQTRFFLRDDDAWLADNWKAGERLLERAATSGVADERQPNRIWRDVPVDSILTFLAAGGYRIHPEHDSMSAEAILAYIRRGDLDASGATLLRSWNVAVVEPSPGGEYSHAEFGPAGRLRLNTRSRLLSGPSDRADIKALMSARDLRIDLDPQANSANGWDDIKELRKQLGPLSGGERPLLLLYPIDKKSNPRPPRPRKPQVRTSLDATRNVLGLGIYFPMRDHPKGYLEAALRPAQVEEFEDAELNEEIQAMIEAADNA